MGSHQRQVASFNGIALINFMVLVFFKEKTCNVSKWCSYLLSATCILSENKRRLYFIVTASTVTHMVYHSCSASHLLFHVIVIDRHEMRRSTSNTQTKIIKMINKNNYSVEFTSEFNIKHLPNIEHIEIISR